MEDLQYIVNLGFSGTDLPRAVALSFLLAMFLKKHGNIWRMALIALVIDRIIWPIVAMSFSAEIQSVYASIGALGKTFFNDLGIYVVRYVGLVTMIALFAWARRQVHKMAPKKPKPAAA